MRYDGHSPHTGALPGPAATEPAGRPFTVSLIGGPADGRAIAVNQPGEWLEVAGVRYVLRAAYKSGATGPDGHVGIFLPLYAHLWASHPREVARDASSKVADHLDAALSAAGHQSLDHQQAASLGAIFVTAR